jgi:hypothetical protein
MEKKPKEANAYSKILEAIFNEKYKDGATKVDFHRTDVERYGMRLGISPKNLGDVVYSFRYRRELPESIKRCAPSGKQWIIRPTGRSMYAFELVVQTNFLPNPGLAVIKVPDSTPGLIHMYSMGDEQAVLAMVRYNRLVDIFTGITSYSLQSHLRTTVPGMGQVETDEVYVGVDKRGVHYVFPVQAKSQTDKIGVVQVEQDLAMCRDKVPNLICRPLAAQSIGDGILALFEFIEQAGEVRLVAERHYMIVPPEEVTDSDLSSYINSG